jgi:hypothetical protein
MRQCSANCERSIEALRGRLKVLRPPVRTLSAPGQYRLTRSRTSGTKVQYRLDRIVNILPNASVCAFPGSRRLEYSRPELQALHLPNLDGDSGAGFHRTFLALTLT